jgi:hypothetical protein
MAAFGGSCRHRGHGLAAATDPLRSSMVKIFCVARFLFDHFVGTQQNRLWHRQTERLGGLKVYDHLEFCRKLYWEIARPRAA